MAELKILVLDRGHVRIAYVESHPEKAFHYRLPVSRCIRRWGTTGGLAQLAASGPTSDTKLDDIHSSSVPWRAVIEVIDVQPEAEEKWKPFLEAQPRRTSKQR